MKSNWFRRNYESIIRISYIIPILVAAGISIYHVISWYSITNPIGWALYLSIGIEIAALSALAGMTAKMNKWVYLPFIIVTFIQIIGNIFSSYQYIDINGEMFRSWVELFNPLFESFGWVKNGDIMMHKRILGILGGMFIPLISLSFLHLLISFNDKKEKDKGPSEGPSEGPSMETVREQTQEKWESLGFLDGLKEHVKEPTINLSSEGPSDEELKEAMETEEETIDWDGLEQDTIDKAMEVGIENNPDDYPYPPGYVPPEENVEIPPIPPSISVKAQTNNRKPVIPTGKVERDDIPEVKGRGFSVKIPNNVQQSNNSINRINDGKN